MKQVLGLIKTGLNPENILKNKTPFERYLLKRCMLIVIILLIIAVFMLAGVYLYYRKYLPEDIVGEIITNAFSRRNRDY